MLKDACCKMLEDAKIVKWFWKMLEWVDTRWKMLKQAETPLKDGKTWWKIVHIKIYWKDGEKLLKGVKGEVWTQIDPDFYLLDWKSSIIRIEQKTHQNIDFWLSYEVPKFEKANLGFVSSKITLEYSMARILESGLKIRLTNS